MSLERRIFYFRNSLTPRPRFSSRWWKILLWLGSILVLAGLFLLLIGLILPRKKINVDLSSSSSASSDSQVIIVDRQALAYNTNLDTSHLIGVCLVVVGGILFTLSLLMPTFCHMWCANGDGNEETDPLRVRQARRSSFFATTPSFFSSVPVANGSLIK